jgi:NTP pyrophosphatase (non-canonical NTP hydrolase)
MTFDQYEKIASSTAIYPNRGNNLVYPTLGLAGETGEVAEKVKKLIRDKNGKITDEFKDEIKKELGDVLWYIAAVAFELNLSMDEIAKTNLHKLSKRKEEGKLKGSGDNR